MEKIIDRHGKTIRKGDTVQLVDIPLELLLGLTESEQKILRAEIGNMHLIFVSGSTGRVKESSWGCAMCFSLVFGYGFRDYETRLTASILDLHQKETVTDDLENISEGTSWLGFFVVIPIWYSPSTRSDSCRDIGNRLGKILLDRSKQ